MDIMDVVTRVKLTSTWREEKEERILIKENFFFFRYTFPVFTQKTKKRLKVECFSCEPSSTSKSHFPFTVIKKVFMLFMLLRKWLVVVT